MTSEDTTERVVAVNRGAQQSDRAAPSRGEAHRALDAWIGRWINQGHMIDEHGNAGLPITTSDVYEWAPGGLFVVDAAFGRIGGFGVGGVEIVGYDAASGDFASHFFDSEGNHGGRPDDARRIRSVPDQAVEPAPERSGGASHRWWGRKSATVRVADHARPMSRVG